MPYKDPNKQREYQRDWRAKRRAEWLAGKSCVDCGSIERLEIDHVDPTRKVSHKLWSWTQARREAELAKCVVRCAECHRERSAEQYSERYRQPLVHGTRHGYQTHGCRCDLCRQAQRVHNAKYG